MNQDPEKDYRGDRKRILRKHLVLDFNAANSLAEKNREIKIIYQREKSRIIGKEEYQRKKVWGLLTSIDLFGCNPEIIRNADKVKQFVRELCELIDMKRFGETVVVDFGADPKVAGFSMTQLIETSLISGHFANQSNSVYIDIFSCKWYDQEKAVEFAKNFFKARKADFNVAIRGKGFEK